MEVKHAIKQIKSTVGEGISRFCLRLEVGFQTFLSDLYIKNLIRVGKNADFGATGDLDSLQVSKPCLRVCFEYLTPRVD